jgi:CDP-glycerol glycerophosphotransferase
MTFRIVNAVLYWLSGLVPRDRKKVLFGAWMGHRYADNPKYLLLYLAEHDPGLKLVWCGHESVRARLPRETRIRFVQYGSPRALLEVLTAGSCFVSHGFRDVSRFNLLRGCVLTYLGHGLAIKHMGSVDRPLKSRIWTAVRRILRQAESFDYYVAVSAEHRRKLMKENAANNIRPEAILDIGQPRVDFLLRATSDSRLADLRRRFLAELQLPDVRVVISYMPTFRDKAAVNFSFAGLSGEHLSQVESLLQRYDAIILEKNHFRDAIGGPAAAGSNSTRIVRLDESRVVDTQELLLSTDLLITDYSGCYLDYLILDRPVVHFAYDRSYYTQADRGLYFHLDAIAGGPVVERIEDLLQALEDNLRDPNREGARRADVRRKLIEYERGVSSIELARLVAGSGVPA